jgi:hypothetical protein
MKPPTRKLIGGVRESHTREYLFQISAQMSGCRRRSRFRAQEQQEQQNQSKNTSFWEEGERVREERPPGGACGPQEGGWRGQELGHTTLPPRPGVDPPGQPQVPPDGFLPGNFDFDFSGIFWATSL